MSNNSVTGSAGGVKHRRRQHGRITQIMPPTQQWANDLQWTCDYFNALSDSGCHEFAFDFADTMAREDAKRDRSWSGNIELYGYWWNEYRRGKATPLLASVPFSGDFSDVGPEWEREEYVGS